MASDFRLPPIDDGGAEDSAVSEALEMNRRLKAMLREMEASGGPAAAAVLPKRGPKPVARSADAPARARRVESYDVRSTIDNTVPDRGPARAAKSNFTFGDDKLVEIGKGNHRLVEKLSRIATERKPGTLSFSVLEPKGPSVASSAINRRRAASKIQADNEVSGCVRCTHVSFAIRETVPDRCDFRHF